MTFTPLSAVGWPSADHLLLVRAATLEPEAALAAWREWRAHNTIAAADHASFPLLPQVARNLRGQPMDHADRAALTSVYRWSWAQNHYLVGRLAAALRTLHEAGVATMVYKGVALALFHYGDLAARTMWDTDVLIRVEDLPRAQAALAADGWRFPDVVPAETFGALLHELPLWDGHRVSVDLHWRIFPMVTGFEAGCWERSLRCEVGGVSTRMPGVEDLFLTTLLTSRQIEDQSRARWLVDAATLVRGVAGGLDWAAAVAHAEASGFLLPLRDTLGYLGAVMPGLVPAEVEGAVTPHSVSQGEAEQYALFDAFMTPLPESTLGGIVRAHWRSYAQQWCPVVAERPGASGFLRYLWLRYRARWGYRTRRKVLWRFAAKVGQRLLLGRRTWSPATPTTGGTAGPAGRAPRPPFEEPR